MNTAYREHGIKESLAIPLTNQSVLLIKMKTPAREILPLMDEAMRFVEENVLDRLIPQIVPIMEYLKSRRNYPEDSP